MRGRGIVAALTLMLGWPLATSAGGAAELEQDYEKILAARLRSDRSGWSVVRSAAAYGSAPDAVRAAPPSSNLTCALLRTDGTPLAEFPIRDPRLPSIESSGEPESVSGETTIVVRFARDLRFLVLLDADSGKTLLELDFGPSILSLCTSPEAVGDPDCPLLDLDGDGRTLGEDPCDMDAGNDVDGDGVCGNVDNCPTVPNPDQSNVDGDAEGDACDCAPTDPANDQAPEVGDSLLVGKENGVAVISWSDEGVPGPFNLYRGWMKPAIPWQYDHYCGAEAVWAATVPDALEPLPYSAFYYLVTRQGCGESIPGRDSAGNPIPNGDPCPSTGIDADGDGIEEAIDTCSGLADPLQDDPDQDGHGTPCDNCSVQLNPNQENRDGDRLGDACDPDVDGDGIGDDGDESGAVGDNPCQAGATSNCDDNCPLLVNADQKDTDGDGRGDLCDNCPNHSNLDQTDVNGNGVGEACEIGIAITALKPAGAMAGSPDLLLKAKGFGFAEGTRVRFNGLDLATTFESTTDLKATVPAPSLDVAGVYPVQAVTADGQASLAALFTVREMLALGALVPSGVAAGTTDFELTASGEGFRKGAVVRFDGNDLATTYVGSMMLTAIVPATFVATPGSATLIVANPSGQESEPQTFSIVDLSIDTIDPGSGPIGTPVTITGTGLDLPPIVQFEQVGGGVIEVPAANFAPTSLEVFVPAGATTGNLRLVSGGLVLTGPVFTVTTSKTFDLEAGPGTGILFPGRETRYSVSATSADDYTALIDLSVDGLPPGVTAEFTLPRISVGQPSILILDAAPDLPTGVIPFTVTGTSVFEGQTIVRSVGLEADVRPITTTFLGRTVASDPAQTPLAGVIVDFLGLDDAGKPTGCDVPPVVTDFAGNYVFQDLPLACTGVQLVSFNGDTVTNPPGQRYASVNLRFVIEEGVINPAPVVTHLVRIDAAETVEIRQDWPVTQVFTFQTIPGLKVEVYPGTIFTLPPEYCPPPESCTPDPFQLVAVAVATDRLPDRKALPPGQVLSFIVAFQPANAFTNEPVAIDYPNVTSRLPGENLVLLTLDPTRGMMVMYGTGTISPDGVSLAADPDPARPGRRYGITHFDWHGPMSPPPPPETGGPASPSTPDLNGPNTAGGNRNGDPTRCRRRSVEYATGREQLDDVDAAIDGIPLPVRFVRTYRSDLGSFLGPFGRGATHSFDYRILAGPDTTEPMIEMTLPAGRRIPFARRQDGTYGNVGLPEVLSSTISWDASLGGYRYDAADGSKLNFGNNAGNNQFLLTEIRDRRGNVVAIERALVNGVSGTMVGLVATNGDRLDFEYTGQRITTLTDHADRITRYTYDGQGRLETVTDPMGGVTRYTYDAQHRLTSITDARGVLVVQKAYDENGRVISESFPDGGVRTYEYVTSRNLPGEVGEDPGDDDEGADVVLSTTVTDPRGNSTTYRFNVAGVLTDVTDALGQTTSYTLDPATGRYASRRGTAGCSTCGAGVGVGGETYTWDPKGRLATLTDALGHTTTFTYPEVGNFPLTITDALKQPTTFEQNEYAEVTKIIDPGGNETEIEYDGRGRITRITDPNGNSMSFEYGLDLRMAKIIDPLARETSFEYDAAGRLTALVLPNGSRYEYRYDDVDRLVESEDPMRRTTQYTYDEVGNLQSVTDPIGNAIAFVYDPKNRLAEEHTAAGGIRRYEYDQVDNLTAYFPPAGLDYSFAYSYDRLDRLVRSVVPGPRGESHLEELVYTWDAAGRLVGAENTDMAEWLQRDYDAVNRLISETTRLGNVTYGYDAIGRRDSRSAPAGTTTYDYNLQSLLASISSPTTTATFVYDAGGRLRTSTLPNGVSASFDYDKADQLLQLSYHRLGRLLEYRAYEYDLVGSIISISGDHLSGPLPSDQVATYAPGNQTHSLNGLLHTFDADGRLLADGRHDYTWSRRGQLTRISGPDGETSHVYDGLGRRVRRSVDGVVTEYVYDGFDVLHIHGIVGTKGFFRGLALDENLAEETAGVPLTYLTDHLGSTIGVVDFSGNTTFFAYDDYGKVTTDGDLPMPVFTFTGREADGKDVHYYRARYYDANAGRFVSEDPLAVDPETAGSNRYLYVSNSPVDLSDATGESPLLFVPIVIWLVLNNPDTANAPGCNDPILPSQGVQGMVRDAVLGRFLGWSPSNPRHLLVNGNPLLRIGPGWKKGVGGVFRIAIGPGKWKPKSTWAKRIRHPKDFEIPQEWHRKLVDWEEGLARFLQRHTRF